MIGTLLVANRGEIARRVIRSARRLGITTVAVFSDADADAPHVAEADLAVRLPGVTPGETYLDAAAILAAARATGADAVHPGYGFLSENASFARACADAGLTFVGPSPEIIESMGSKTGAKEVMARAGVPVLPGVVVDDATDLGAAAAAIGLPLLVKAVFGGGGRGMRVVRDGDDVVPEVASAQREAASAFGDGTVFLERYVDDPRHVEVQVFGDTHGNVVHLYERDCSIQRRYQKVIEEAPAPLLSARTRDRLCSAAVDAARALGYVGAGTVEFVVAADESFYFLEVNTRLQVEHPVTELVTGLDLVEAQLRVAAGEVLPAPLLAPELRGHAVEARLYAEDVPAGFVPASGRFVRIAIEEAADLRVDAGYVDGSVVSTHYDAMVAKVIAWAPTRVAAIERLAGALAAARLHGPPTNRDLLVNVLRHPDFVAGRVDTGFLSRHDCTTPLAAPARRAVHAIAAALAGQAERRVGAHLPSGWRNVPTNPQHATFEDLDVAYRICREGLDVTVDGEPIDVVVWSATPDVVDLTVAGVRRRVAVARGDGRVHVDDGTASSVLIEQERFPLPVQRVQPGSLVAALPGSVVRVLGAVGDDVVAGDALVVIEAMKMEHRVDSPVTGTIVELCVAVGDQVETGAMLAVVAAPEDAA